jgi:hypothetical protein
VKKLTLAILLCVVTLPVFAAKRIIVVKQSTNGSNVCYSVANWYVITTGQQAQTAGSQWSGASTPENTAIQNGSVLEEMANQCFPVAQDVTSIKSVLVQQWTNRNAQIGGIGPAQYQGVYFDATTGWSQ